MGIQLIVPGLDRDAARNRINELLNQKSKAEQALIKEKTGIDNKKIINVLGGEKVREKGGPKTNISMEFMAIFAQALSVPLEYILYGTTPSLNIGEDTFYNVPYIENAPRNEANYKYSNKEHICAMRIDSLLKITEDYKNIVLYEIDSDVMENTFFKGDKVLIDMSKKYIVDGGIYAYNSFDYKCIRVRRFSVGVDRLILMADNKDRYESCISKKTDINIIGQVIMSKHFL